MPKLAPEWGNPAGPLAGHVAQLAADLSNKLLKWSLEWSVNVRFGSKADIAVCLGNVRFTPQKG